MREASKAAIRVSSLALLALLALAAGCINVEQNLTIHKDGSGVIDLTYGMSEETLSRLGSMAAMSGLADDGASEVSNPFDQTEAEIREEFKDYAGSGVTLESVKTETRGGWRYRTMVIRFKNLKGLADVGFLSDQNVALVKNEQGNYVLTQNVTSSAAQNQGLPEIGDVSSDPVMAELMKGFRVVMRIKTPSPILETNAPRKTADTATWILDLQEDPKALDKAQRLSIRVVFDGKGVNIPSFKQISGSTS